MKKSTMAALGCGAGTPGSFAPQNYGSWQSQRPVLAVHFWKRRQTKGVIACGVMGGCAAAVAAGGAVCALRKREALRMEYRETPLLTKLGGLADEGDSFEHGNIDSSWLQVGQKVENAEYVGEMSGNEDFKVIKNFDFKQHRFSIPVEGIGINSSAVFSLTSTLSNRFLEIFASGWFAGKNLVDNYQLFGEATLVVNGINLGRQIFVIPNYNYISKGYPYQTIGEASFFHLFSRKDSIRLILDLWVKIETDSGVNKGFWRYPAKEVVIQ